MTISRIVQGWFDEGVKDNQKWMVIICDTFDYEDYPVYFDENQRQGCRDRIREAQHGKNMQRLMEVYDLTAPKDPQFVPGILVMNAPRR